MNTAHKTLSTLLGIALVALLGNNAMANENHGRKHDNMRHTHTAGKNIDARQYQQKERIKNGVRSGQLTKEEAKGLVVQQREIRREEHQYRADGKFTKEERKDVQHDLNEASKSIRQEKHDSETRK